MKIKKLDVYHIRLPLISPWQTAYGIEEGVESVLVKAYSDNAEAWVETCPLGKPFYSSETAKSAYHNIVDHFAPAVLCKDLVDGDTIPSLLNPFQGNSFAKAGVEQCWWGLTAIEKSIPLCQLISGNDVNNINDINVRSAFGITGSIEILLAKISEVVDSGVKDIKIKIKNAWDTEVIKQVVEKFPNLKITIDCNGGYSMEDLDFFRRIDDYGLEMIEQPLAYNDLYDHALLQKEIHTPICLDESIGSIDDAKLAVKLESCRIINIKPGRVGGISRAIKIHELCRKNGLSCLVGGMMESGIGTVFNIELAAAFNSDYANGITLPSDYHKIELTEPPISCSTPGKIDLKIESTPKVKEDIVEKITISKQIIE